MLGRWAIGVGGDWDPGPQDFIDGEAVGEDRLKQWPWKWVLESGHQGCSSRGGPRLLGE